MLQFENVSTFYGKIQALHSVNVEVRQGEIVTLIGANGAGKSTLMMTLCGSPQAHSGSIRYLGEELVGLSSAQIMRKSIAVVPEGRRVFARLTVEEAHDAFDEDQIVFLRGLGQAGADVVLAADPEIEVVAGLATGHGVNLRVEKVRAALEDAHLAAEPGVQSRQRGDDGGLALA